MPKYQDAIDEELRPASPTRRAKPARDNQSDASLPNEPRWMVRCRCGDHHDNTTCLDCERCTRPMIACDECDVWLHLECLGFASGCSKATALRRETASDRAVCWIWTSRSRLGLNHSCVTIPAEPPLRVCLQTMPEGGAAP